MKKISLIFAVLAAVMLMAVSCANTKTDENKGGAVEGKVDTTVASVVNVGALKGPTGMGLVKLMEDSGNVSDSDFVYDFTLDSAADMIVTKITKGELDIAAVPANLASILYNRLEGDIVVLNINTLGVLYIAENGESVKTVEDLRGKKIYASGKGNTPEYALNYMLEAYGLVPGVDVLVEYKTEHAECLAAILAEENSVAMLPQPFVTNATMQNSGVRIALDINAEWEAKTGKQHVTGVTIARKSFVESNPEAVKTFLDGYKASVEYVNNNVADAAQLIEKHGIFKAAVAEKALPKCSISYIDGAEMKQILSEYLVILSGQNPQAVGGALPGDDFYYTAE